MLTMKQSICLLLPVLIAGCSGSAKTDTGSHATDSVNATEPEVLMEPVASLPDTVFPSAREIAFSVTVKDTATAPEINLSTQLYDSSKGILTFRGNPRRDADFGGRVSGRPSDITVDWTFRTDTDNRDTKYGRWGGGTGWTGQPLILNSEGGTKEVIVGSLSSNVYFIDFNTGNESRPKLPAFNPIKGTVSLDPTLNGNLYVGQGVPAEDPFGALTYNLKEHRLTHTFGMDPGARRRWGAYDSSAIRVGDFVIRPGENGTIYKWLPGDDGSMKLHSLMCYSVNGASPGIESSMAVYRNYGFTADNHGNVICIDLDTLRPVWIYRTGDDSDATPVVAEESDGVYLYVCSEIDRQGEGTARFAKLDALTGSPVWEKREPGCRYDADEKHFDGGFYASPLLGQGKSSGLIFANLVQNTDGQNGCMVAYSRKDGREVWRTPLRYYSWSSPVGFLNEAGEMFILTGDSAGNLYLIDAADGSIIVRRRIGSNFESSPAVSGNSAVVGSRGDAIYRISIK